MAKNIENCSILIIFRARVFLTSRLFQCYAHSLILGCSDIFGAEHLHMHDKFKISNMSEMDG